MKDDGGPAFPVEINHGTLEYPKTIRHSGASLRDYFAGQALMGLAWKARGPDAEGYYAMIAYKYADAMLEARKA